MGRLIALVGGEGAGKTTLAAALTARIEAAGFETLAVREPGGTPAGERLRDVLREPIVPWAETFVFLAARAQLVEAVVRPALARGAVVITDRYVHSTYAYQGYGRGLPLDVLRRASDSATGGLEPDVVILLDLDPAAGLARKHGERDPIATGAEDVVFHRRVRAGYHALAAAEPARWHIIDAASPPGEVAAAAWAAVEPLLPALEA